MEVVQPDEASDTGRPSRPHRRLATLALPVLAGLLAASPADAWTPATQLEIAQQAAKIAPPDLRRQLERHPQALQRGVLEPFERASPDHHVRNADGSGRLDSVILGETRAAIEAIRDHRPFAEIVHRLGRISHYLADANNPLSTSRSDPREPTYTDDYLRYVESAQDRFTVVFYGRGRALESREELPALLRITLDRSRKLYPEVGREYDRIGAVRGSELFDDRSTAFGVASLAFSHAVSDVAAVMRHVWIEAGGADQRSLPWTGIRRAPHGRSR